MPPPNSYNVGSFPPQDESSQHSTANEPGDNNLETSEQTAENPQDENSLPNTENDQVADSVIAPEK
eukprot:CAMPEP_0113944740 /NCGR_PEP_ID=MMETSP1339-20121228/36337_1 /TAXON_ID=94617 /ORGANISM="Fibrocapsa japonica" /LENGTH=65 /DNA_ID=CAMNT_0000950047 /DNA_START=93 /DNA_END=290 /DNA_ORIENTATION=+ /assembly_acc=CAM_ASM_000762